MADELSVVLNRNENSGSGFGFSLLRKPGVPPIIYDISHDSPAAASGKVSKCFFCAAHSGPTVSGNPLDCVQRLFVVNWGALCDTSPRLHPSVIAVTGCYSCFSGPRLFVTSKVVDFYLVLTLPLLRFI